MNLRGVLLRLAVGATVYAVLGTALAPAEPLTIHLILGGALTLSVVIIGQNVQTGLGSPKLGRYLSYPIAAAIAATVVYILFFLSGGAVPA